MEYRAEFILKAEAIDGDIFGSYGVYKSDKTMFLIAENSEYLFKDKRKPTL